MKDKLTRHQTSPDLRRQGGKVPAEPSGARDIAAFLDKAKAMKQTGQGGTGRLLFALDATMSRQPTWDSACELQAEMFREVAGLGSLDIQLIYYRGLGECRASRWVRDGEALAEMMSKIDCRGGRTQIGRVLKHAVAATRQHRISALVFVGDAMEEDADALCVAAGELGLRGVPAFMFQEGGNRHVEATFREIARLTKGAYCRFDSGSAKQLGELLRAVAVFATGGYEALIAYGERGEPGGRKLLEQMR